MHAFFLIISYRVFCSGCEIRRVSCLFSLLFYFIVVGLSVPKVTTHCGTDNAGFTVRCWSYGPLFGLGVMAVLFRGQIMYILSMFSKQLPDAEDSKRDIVWPCAFVCVCVRVCVLFCFRMCCIFVFVLLIYYFTVVRSLMVRSRRCNPLIAACNCSIGNVHGPLRWSPLTASVACPGVNWYSRVGGTLYHIQGAGASGFEGLGVCRGLVAAPAAKAFERPHRQGQRRRGNLERSFLETNKKRKVKVEN